MLKSSTTRAGFDRKNPAKSPAKKSHAGFAPKTRSFPKKAAAKSPPRKAAPVRLHPKYPALSKHAQDKIAPCEISGVAADNERSKRAINSSKVADPAAKTNALTGSSAMPPRAERATAMTPDEAYAKMKSARQIGGMLAEATWTQKGFATLEACIAAMDVWGDDKAICNAIRYRLKKERGGRRALNGNNPYLIAIHCCHDKPTRAQRSEFTRFSKVVEVARFHNVKPEDAETWLKSRTQASILDEARALRGKKPAATRAVIASKTVRPRIWQAIQAGMGDEFDYVVQRLDKLEEELAQGFE